MPKTAGGKRLSEQDAADFREVVRKLRTLNQITNQRIADELHWELRRVTDALTARRPLLRRTAYELYVGIGSIVPDERILFPGSPPWYPKRLNAIVRPYDRKATWMDEYEKTLRQPEVLVRRDDRERLAELLASEVRRVNGVRFSDGTERAVARQLERYLNKAALDTREVIDKIVGDRTNALLNDPESLRPIVPRGHVLLRGRKKR